MKWHILLTVLVFSLLSGCTHVITEENRKLVDPVLTISKLRESPESAIGKYIMLGGIIASARNTKEGGRIEVVEFKLDETGFPLESSHSGGRFLATTTDFIDSMIYRPGRLVTVLGEVKGKKVIPFDEVDYTYPVLTIKEAFAWKFSQCDREFLYPHVSPYQNFTPSNYGNDQILPPGRTFLKPGIGE